MFCSSSRESIGHLCFECPFSIDVFRHLNASFDWPIPPSCLQSIDLSSFRSSLKACLSLFKARYTRFSFIWWFVWYFRNKIIFNDEVVSSRKASALIINLLLLGLKLFQLKWLVLLFPRVQLLRGILLVLVLRRAGPPRPWFI